MTRAEAQRVLLLYRPGPPETGDPDMLEALELAKRDPELGQWFDQHRAFQKTVSARLQQIEVPAHLRTSLLARAQAPATLLTPPQPTWRRPFWLAAAVIVLAACLLGLWLRPRAGDEFANYRARMVSGVLREYQMDIKTNDMRLVRQDLGSRGAPADYVVPRGLERLHLTGGGRLTWRNNPVAMVCFDRGDNRMLYLFVLKRSAINDPPPGTPRLAKVNELLTASWTQGDETYVLAGPEEPGFVQKYL
ncbi:MAG TPA: hypothetical protein VMU04_21145 [Candidatus Acidoferrum sp.]|nr:hypothetical protein [Candidatus Acidoferrum sp.]